MKTYVRTESRSLYVVDDKAMTWARVWEEIENSGLLPTDEGDLSRVPPIRLNEPRMPLGELPC
jgi:hypothetical protein